VVERQNRHPTSQLKTADRVAYVTVRKKASDIDISKFYLTNCTY